MELEFLRSIDEVEPDAWSALIGEDDPFVEHAFLSVLEQSGSVGPGSGWSPRHVVVRDAGELVGALPLYLKDHSYGEYIFDWAWASASERAGILYYPKLVSMVPMTPATGRRLLIRESADPRAVTKRLLDGAFEQLAREGASSLHLLFLADDERALVAEDGRLLPRLSRQFHFHNDGYGSFDDFAGRFRSDMKKKLRRERREVAQSGLEITLLTGDAIEPAHVAAMRAFYEDTCARKGAYAYLTPRFFELAAERLRHLMVLCFALEDGAPVAGSLSFEKGKHLYGRYWGCAEDYAMLHFELCYYQLIDRAIARGVTRFEAGAQGEHKLRRGMLPVAIHSAHFVAHPALRDAVAEFLPREAASVRQELEALSAHGPFRRGA